MIHGYICSGRPPLAEPPVTVLGHELSPRARLFAAEYADFLARMDFKDIADHPQEYIRSAEAHCSCDGQRHTIWLDKESHDFESLMMHQVMRGILMERGFPRTACLPIATFNSLLLYLSSLLSSAVTDPIIDGWLAKGGHGVYDREVLIRRTMAQVWLDAQRGTPKPYGFLFCKWTLLTVLMRLDPTFEGDALNLLLALLRKKFQGPSELAEELSESIKKKGFTEPCTALTAMLALREALRLQGRIAIVDREDRRL
jgi:hypothetical protein